ncbi:MAG: NAD(+) synthase [Muribaculaceae bacterium]|nr:NAD(+) synthase [Muribaculaceae bacterium]
MTTDGFLRVASVAPHVSPCNTEFNTDKIIEHLQALEAEHVEIAVFPELCITGYTCADLFHSETLLGAAKDSLNRLIDWSKGRKIAFIVGLPWPTEQGLRNRAVLVCNGATAHWDKTWLPSYNEFYEKRWFTNACPCEKQPVVEVHGVKVGVEICEDLWAPTPPSSDMALRGAEVIFNLSASDDLIGKYSWLRGLISSQSGRCLCAYVYAGAGWGESSTDLVFDGKTIIAENGTILQSNPRFAPQDNVVIADIDIFALRHERIHNTTFATASNAAAGAPAAQMPSLPVAIPASEQLKYRHIAPHPFVPSDSANLAARCREISQIQAAGLARRLDAIRCKTIVVGISGGLDSTLALLVGVAAFDRLGLDRKGIIGITMPGFGTSGRTHDNSVRLMDALGVTSREIPIGETVMRHFSDIGHDPELHDVTYENCQARYRTMILMDVANQTGGIVLGTGDLSELALGWATYNGDHMSMYGVNVSVPKTLVRFLVSQYAQNEPEGSLLRATLEDIVDTPVSPELLPTDAKGQIAQKTEDLVGPYELHDFFLYYTLRFGFTPRRIFAMARHAFTGAYEDATIKHWLKTFMRRFFSQQFKRSCMPDGPKVGSVCLSPRGDWRMPSDASSALWLKEAESL